MFGKEWVSERILCRLRGSCAKLGFGVGTNPLELRRCVTREVGKGFRERSGGKSSREVGQRLDGRISDKLLGSNAVFYAETPTC